MEPSFKVIADLFQVPQGDTEINESEAKVGETSAESQALGRASLNDGDYEKAIEHFRRAVEQRDLGDASALVDLGGAYSVTDQLPEAYRQYERALRIKEEAEPHVGLSELYKRYGRWKDAIAELDDAIKLEPDNPYHHFKLADTLKEMGERKRAAEAIRFAIAAKPDEPFYHYWTGDLLLSMGRADEALDSFRAAIELSPSDDHLYLRAAVAFWRANRRDESIKSIRLAAELDPDNDFYHAVLHGLLDRNGQTDDAVAEQEHVERLDRYDEERLRRVLQEVDA